MSGVSNVENMVNTVADSTTSRFTLTASKDSTSKTELRHLRNHYTNTSKTDSTTTYLETTTLLKSKATSTTTYYTILV
ncbi:hypothetical protein G9A89_006040 [Geosiphon pyriformis]|nr:hypothetical protein G9A89_006040 [Geosiphon pyriformis]